MKHTSRARLCAILLILAMLLGVIPATNAAESTAPEAPVLTEEQTKTIQELAAAGKISTLTADEMEAKDTEGPCLIPYYFVQDTTAVLNQSDFRFSFSKICLTATDHSFICIYKGSLETSSFSSPIEGATRTDDTAYLWPDNYRWQPTSEHYSAGDYCVVTFFTDANGNIYEDSVYGADLHVTNTPVPLKSLALADAITGELYGPVVVLEPNTLYPLYVEFTPYNTTCDRDLYIHTTSDRAVAEIVVKEDGQLYLQSRASGYAVVEAQAGEYVKKQLIYVDGIDGLIATQDVYTGHDGSRIWVGVTPQPQNPARIRWTVQDTSVARAYNNGLNEGTLNSLTGEITHFVTCNGPGETTLVASCGYHEAVSTIVVTPHEAGEGGTHIANTATQPGVESGTCTICGASFHYDLAPVFSDTPANAWYAEFVDFVYENEIMNGVASDQFQPTGNLRRSQIATVLYRLAGSPEVTGDSPFSDVANNAWYADAVIWAAQNGIVTGYTDGTFLPDKDITREQIATMLYRYVKTFGGDTSASADLSAFPDADTVQSYALDAMRWAVAMGYINGIAGNGETLLSPRSTATRAQFAAIIARYLQTPVPDPQPEPTPEPDPEPTPEPEVPVDPSEPSESTEPSESETP